MKTELINKHQEAVKRSVELVNRNDKAAATVTISAPIPTTVEDLWDLITNPDKLSEWFLPVSGELKLGGRYALQGNASGTILGCEPNSLISLTWEFGGDIGWLDIQFRPIQDSKCELTLSHTSVLNPHWDQYGAGATGIGWDICLLGMSLMLSGPDAVKLDEMTFVTSKEGSDYVESCADGWAKASVAAGIDPDTAESAAKHSSAFFRGV